VRIRKGSARLSGSPEVKSTAGFGDPGRSGGLV
jgi:hypothetical protein